jgi:hypothetical protein
VPTFATVIHRGNFSKSHRKLHIQKNVVSLLKQNNYEELEITGT